jgi:hypothetical protein
MEMGAGGNAGGEGMGDGGGEGGGGFVGMGQFGQGMGTYSSLPGMVISPPPVPEISAPTPPQARIFVNACESKCVCVFLCVCVCVCVSERERQRESARERERESMCVCVCACVRVSDYINMDVSNIFVFHVETYFNVQKGVYWTHFRLNTYFVFKRINCLARNRVCVVRLCLCPCPVCVCVCVFMCVCVCRHRCCHLVKWCSVYGSMNGIRTAAVFQKS